MTPTDRCAWTGERSDRLVTVELPSVDRLGRPAAPLTVSVLPEHEAELRAYVERVRRFGTGFLVAVVVIGVLAFGAALAPVVTEEFAGPAIVVSGVLVAGIGALFLAFPFTTPETIRFFGIRRSMRIARGLGTITVILGLGIALFG